MTSFLWSIGGFFIILTPIILVHELGHFWAALLSKIKVDEFGLGFPPRAAKLAERNGTVYSLNWIPLGGFVRPAGEDDPNVPGGLASASKRARLFVLFAGAGMNFITAFFIFFAAYIVGPPAIEILQVNPDSPALTAGLQEGDTILAVNGRKADTTGTLLQEIQANSGQAVTLLLDRNGSEVETDLVPRQPGEYDPAVDGPIGITLTFSEDMNISRPIGEAATESLNTMWEIVYLTVTVPAMLIQGDIEPSEARPISVVGISQIAGQAAESSVERRNLFPILNMAGFISVALGFTNLLPIPALDGGRILFVLIEAVRGRRIEPEREGMVHIVGMLVLLGLMVLLIVQDIVNPIF